MSIPPDILQKLATGFAAQSTGVGLFAPDDTIVFASPSLMENWNIPALGCTFQDMVRHCHRTRSGPIIAANDVEEWLRSAQRKRRSAPERCFEVDLHDGRWFWVTEVMFDGGWLLITVCDITQLKASERAMRLARDKALHWAETDSLTGLQNRRCIMKRLAELAKSANLSGSALSVALLDIDHFKTINDSNGHDVGDKVLQHFAATGRAFVRGNDLLARIGGEEFLLVLPDASIDEAYTVVERLREVTARSWPLGHGSIRYTFSAGVAQLRSGEGSEQIYARSDKALYRAKNGGRNRVETDINELRVA